MECTGIDIFVVDGDKIPALPKEIGGLKLDLISNRGTKVPLDGSDPGFLLVDWYRARYLSSSRVTSSQISELIDEISKICEWEKVQKLYSENGEALYSKAHG